MNRNRNHFNLNIMKCFKNDFKWAKSMLKISSGLLKFSLFLMKIYQFSEFFFCFIWIVCFILITLVKNKFLTEIQKLKIFFIFNLCMHLNKEWPKKLMVVIILAVNWFEIEVFHRKRVSRHTVCIKLWFLWWSVKDGYHWSSLYNIINRVGPVRAD